MVEAMKIHDSKRGALYMLNVPQPGVHAKGCTIPSGDQWWNIVTVSCGVTKELTIKALYFMLQQ